MNRGGGAVEIEEITDTYRGLTKDVCPQLIGSVIDAGGSVRCAFELEDYSPAAYDSVANTLEVVASSPNPGKTVSADDLSTVTTAGTAAQGDQGSDEETVVLGETITADEGETSPAPAVEEPAVQGEPAQAESLPTTGARLAGVAGLDLLLGLAGAGFLYLGRRRAQKHLLPVAS